MKSLDEVINVFEKACDLEKRCEDCSGCLSQDYGCPNDGSECVPDALYYLKMYRSDKAQYEIDRENWETTYKEAREHYEAARDKHLDALKKLDIGTLNEPLTWEELQLMVGKPVWVEERMIIDGKERTAKEWALVANVEEKHADLMDFEAEYRLEKCYYILDVPGTDHWQAYRKERDAAA